MKLANVGRLVGMGKALVMANRPEILLGTAIATSISSSILAGIGGFRSGKHMAQADAERAANEQEPMNKVEILNETWKNYIPAAAAQLGALGSIGGLHVVHVKEKKALVATGLAAIEEIRNNHEDYITDIEKSVKEKVTGKKFDEITDEIIDTTGARTGLLEEGSDGILEPHYILRDRHSGTDHWGNRNDVIDAVTQLNRSIVDNGDADLNTFYNHAGWNDTDHGGEVGWTGGERVTVRWSLGTRDDGQPLAQFQLEPAPKRDYDRPNR